MSKDRMDSNQRFGEHFIMSKGRSLRKALGGATTWARVTTAVAPKVDEVEMFYLLDAWRTW